MTLCSSNFCRFFWVYFEMNFITNQLINIERLPIATFKNMVFAPIFPEFQLAEYSVGWPKLSAPNIRPIWPKFSAEYSVSVVHQYGGRLLDNSAHYAICNLFAHEGSILSALSNFIVKAPTLVTETRSFISMKSFLKHGNSVATMYYYIHKNYHSFMQGLIANTG